MRQTPIPAIAILFLALGCAPADPLTDAGATCEPACRSGFVCLHGECVSACNPVCGPGERCTDDGECVPEANDDAGPTERGGDPRDAGSSDDAGATTDAGAHDDDAGTNDAGTPNDASTDGGVPPSCPEGEVLCGASCVAPMLPEVGARTPTSGRYNDDWFEEGDIAIDPCTGNIGLAYTRQIAGGANWEIEVVVIPAAAGASPTTPVRVTTAPGKADSVAVAWAGDRFGVFWSDPRHDPAPETCETRCFQELYYAAFDPTTGAIVVPEVRLTTHSASYRAGGTRALWSPEAREIGVAWTDSGSSRQVHAAIVAPDGAMRAEQEVSAATSPQRGNTPRIVWNDGAWQILYRHDDPDGSRPDYLHTRRLDVTGTLGPDVDLALAAEQIGLTARGASGYATITTGGSSLALRLWDLDWTATTTLPVSIGTYDGSRPLAWDGSSLYATDTGLVVEIVQSNALGTETGRIELTRDTNIRRTNGMRMHRIGSRLVVLWRWSTGGLSPTVHHQIHVVDTSSAM